YGAIFSAANALAMSRMAIWSSGSAKSDIGKGDWQKRCRRAMAPQAVDHLIMGDLMSVLVVVVERSKAWRHRRADHAIGDTPELGDGVSGTDGRCQHDCRRLPDLQQTDRRLHGFAGADRLVDHDHSVTRQAQVE